METLKAYLEVLSEFASYGFSQGVSVYRCLRGYAILKPPSCDGDGKAAAGVISVAAFTPISTKLSREVCEIPRIKFLEMTPLVRY